MNKNISNQSYLAIANRLYREKNYRDALDLYRKAVLHNSSLHKFIAFNIDMCELRLGLKSDATSNFIEHNSTVSNIEIVTSTDCSDIDFSTIVTKASLTFTMPDQDILLAHVKFVKDELVSIESLKTALICLKANPFQRDLLWYVASLANCLGLLSKILADSVNLTSLASLIRLASDPEYWLVNRSKIRSELSNLLEISSFVNLLENAPAKYSETPFLLPEPIPSTCYYKWDAVNHRIPKTVTNITIGTILLNEKKFIGLNLIQHYAICDRWILVEGACKGYPARKVNKQGLSLDNCSAQIRLFPDPDNKLQYVQHGWTSADGEDAKSEMRNRYLEFCNSQFLLVIDADEFYFEEHIKEALADLDDPKTHAVVLPQVHFWKTTESFITGEYYDISHTRIFRHYPGMKYIRNHNFPEIGGKFVHELGQKKFSRTIKESPSKAGSYIYLEPRCYHMGFAKDFDDMRDKSDYYVNRGEATTRKSTTESRAAWFNGELPEKCRVRTWGGPIPSVIKIELGEAE